MRIAVRNLELDDFGTIWSMDWHPLVKERDSIYLEMCLQQRELCFIAETDEDEIAGAVLAGRGTESAFVYHLWVAPAARGRGVGTELVRHLERAAARAGLRYLWLFTTGATGFYERLGYSRDPGLFPGEAGEYVRREKRTDVMVKRL